MIFIQSLMAVIILYLAFSRKLITDTRIIIYLMISLFVFSLLPSLSIPYIFDDVEHMNKLALAIKEQQVLQWLFYPHNEHVIPLLKSIYYLCYTNFWLNPEAFHVFVLAVVIGSIVLTCKLIFTLAGSWTAALIGGAILGGSNITDDAIFVGTNAHIIFCLFLFLFLFYAILQYSATPTFLWRLAAFFAILVLPSTFALGLTSIFFVLLFAHCCVPNDKRANTTKLFPFLLAGWLLSLIPYILALDPIVNAKHYSDAGAGALLGVIQLFASLEFLNHYIALKLIPSVFANPYISFGLFFLCFYTAVTYRKEIPWKKILFFALFGLLNNLVIFLGRSKWGVFYLDTARYYVFPLAMLAFVYPLILDVFIRHIAATKRSATVFLASLACFYVVMEGSLIRYENNAALLNETLVMQRFYDRFKTCFVEYFIENPEITHLRVKQGDISLPPVSRLTPKVGPPPAIGRYPAQTREYYAQYILPITLNNQIIWTDATDPAFRSYAVSRDYMFLVDKE